MFKFTIVKTEDDGVKIDAMISGNTKPSDLIGVLYSFAEVVARFTKKPISLIVDALNITADKIEKHPEHFQKVEDVEVILPRGTGKI